MHVWAAFFDPGGDGFDVTDVAAVLGLVVLIVSSWIALSRYMLAKLRVIVRDEVMKATHPIQPNANGGKSLPDVAANTDWTIAALEVLARAQGVDLPARER